MNAHADSPKEKDEETTRERFTGVAEQLSHLLMILLLALAIGGIPVLYFHLYYCRIPAGTKVINYSVAKPYSPLGEYIAGLSLTKKIPWILPYLQYRHYIIPDGATEIHSGFWKNKYVRSSDRVIRYLIVIGTERCVDTGSVNDLKTVPFISVCLFGRDFRARCNSLIARDHLYDRRLSC